MDIKNVFAKVWLSLCAILAVYAVIYTAYSPLGVVLFGGIVCLIACGITFWCIDYLLFWEEKKKKISLREAYDCVLGGTMAISPPLYNQALKDIARIANREFNDKFKADIKEIQKQISAENKEKDLDW
jgi:hypothetical protein